MSLQRILTAAALALVAVAAMLVPGGRLYIDGGDPLREVALPPS